MILYYISLCTIIIVSALYSQDNMLEGISESFTADILSPNVEIFSPSENESFDGGQVIPVEWEAADDSYIPDNAVDILLSITNLPYDYQPLVEGIPNTGYSDVELPHVDTYLGRIRVLVRDSFGNPGYAEHDGYISIGYSPFQDTTLVIYNITASFVTDINNPEEIEWMYPNGGEEFNIGQSITTEWNVIDDSFDGTDIIIELSDVAGSSYDTVATYIANSGQMDFVLPSTITETALFRVKAIDHYGNESDYDQGDDFFSIGSMENTFQDTVIVIEGITSSFVTDIIPPDSILWVYPNGGEAFDIGQSITTEWNVIDDSFDGTDIVIELSEIAGGDFDTVATYIANSGQMDFVLPSTITETALFRVKATDHYGNESDYDQGDGYFTIGVMEDIFADTTITIHDISDFITVDIIDPQIWLTYPVGGEHVTPYEQAEISWGYDENSWDGTDMDVLVTGQLGGWFSQAADDIAADPGGGVVDLSVNGTVDESFWGLIKIQATDAFGNESNMDMSSYFILGNPEGELDAEWLSEEENLIVLDWGWQIGQLIVIHRNAITSLNIGDEIQIIDPNGILDESCDGENGELVLSSLTYSGEEGHLAFKALCGSDLCEEGGTRFSGYVGGNDILIRYTSVSDNEMITLTPNIELITGSLTFDNGITVISGFQEFEGRNANGRSAGRNNLSVLDEDGGIIMSVDERDYDSYNVYRTTNQANLRDCEDTPGCNMDDGQCVCLIANNVSQNYYFDNYAATTDQWCYDVWLLDNQDDQNELLKTIDSCMGTEIDLLFGDANEDGVVNIIDVVLIVAHIMGTIPPLDGQGLIQADFNQDGVINVIDVVALVAYILGS